MWHLFFGIPLVLVFGLIEIAALLYMIAGLRLYFTSRKEASSFKRRSSIAVVTIAIACALFFLKLFLVIWNLADATFAIG